MRAGVFVPINFLRNRRKKGARSIPEIQRYQVYERTVEKSASKPLRFHQQLRDRWTTKVLIPRGRTGAKYVR